jgi:hypothetical protein
MRPYRAESSAASTHVILNERPTPITRWRTKLDPEVCSVVMKLVSTDSADRLVPAVDLLAALDDPVFDDGSSSTATTQR